MSGWWCEDSSASARAIWVGGWRLETGWEKRLVGEEWSGCGRVGVAMPWIVSSCEYPLSSTGRVECLCTGHLCDMD
jgi:hypothetical protein